jgi:hypothetical protein
MPQVEGHPMNRFRRVFLGAILLLIWTTTCPASAQNTQRMIKEGVGWEHFTVGTSANSLIDVLGFPDKHSRGRMMRWDKVGLNCLLNDKDEAIELRFEKRFKGVTESGVAFGMSADKVHKIYGDAGKMDWRGGGMKLIWPSRGILIWFHNNSVYQIVVFKPQT